MLNYDQAMRMAQKMKTHDQAIQDEIHKCMAAQHGVVALRFYNEGRDMTIETLDEPYDPNVRVYTG